MEPGFFLVALLFLAAISFLLSFLNFKTRKGIEYIIWGLGILFVLSLVLFIFDPSSWNLLSMVAFFILTMVTWLFLKATDDDLRDEITF